MIYTVKERGFNIIFQETEFFYISGSRNFPSSKNKKKTSYISGTGTFSLKLKKA